MAESLIFTCTNKQAIEASQILAEARTKGADVSGLVLDIVGEKMTPWQEDQAKISWPNLRENARKEILVACGANREGSFFQNRPSILDEYDDGISYYTSHGVIFRWRDRWNYPVNPKQKPLWYSSEVVSSLLGLQRERRPLRYAIFWDLGDPEFYLNQGLKGFKDIDPETQTYLFTDERLKLKQDRKVVTYQSDGEFEAYIITQHPELALPTLFRIRAIPRN